MNTVQNILLAEKKTLIPATTLLRPLFTNSRLCGHNMDHHLRVWGNAKRIVTALALKGKEFSLRELTELMLATLFHDTGMINHSGEFHGHAGAELFLSFEEFNSYDIDRHVIAMAIENHDDKSYLHNNTDQRSLLTILSAADDMDAFGIIGFLRYREIYLHRKNTNHNIEADIMRNALKRFTFFRKTWSNLDELLIETQRRYNILINCCKAMEQPQFSETMHLFATRSLSIAAEENQNLITAANTLLSGQFKSVREIIAVKDTATISDML